MDDLAAAVTSEIELRMLAGESLRRLRNLQQLENHRDEMVHMLVHDLRSPLSSLLAGLDGLSIVPGLSATHRAFVTRARRGGNLLIEMIDDILTVSSSEAGRLQLNLQRASPLSMINGALDQLHQLSAAAGVTLAAQAPDDISTVLVDVRLLERVLVNLVANGLAHTPKGGRVLVAAEEREADGAVVFSVADTGAGMSEVDAERVFEKFEQAGSIDGRRRGSFGLGLTFCRMIVEQHGGRIWADSHPGGGAIFRFTIPEVLQGDGSGGLPGRSK
jgi:signal transduction histidine kinase